MKMKHTQGFTLIELMIVVSIIGILASVAIPQYKTYTSKAKFLEVILATSPFKNAFEVAALSGRLPDLSSANTGTNGIPPTTSSTATIQSITMTNGIITGKGTSAVDSVEFILTPNGVTPPIQWEYSGSCFEKAIC